jgi:hypothetical protein
MKYEQLPNPAMAKILSLSSAVEFLSERLAATESGITNARHRLTGGMKPAEYEDLKASLQQLVDDLPALKRRAAAAKDIYAKCREFVDTLPKGAVLEPVKIDVDDHTLDDVRSKIDAAQAELRQLRALPTSSSDIEERVKNYVESMARPTISGIGPGEKLRVFWPGAGFGPSGPNEHKADPLAMPALLHPDEMTAALLREVERMTSGVVPIKDRASRISALTTEIEKLGYLEEVLIERSDESIERSPNALPQTVLQVRVARQKAPVPA